MADWQTYQNNITKWFADNPTATEADVRKALNEWGVGGASYDPNSGLMSFEGLNYKGAKAYQPPPASGLGSPNPQIQTNIDNYFKANPGATAEKIRADMAAQGITGVDFDPAAGTFKYDGYTYKAPVTSTSGSAGALGTNQTQADKDAIFAKFNGLLAEGKLQEAITLAGQNGRSRDEVLAYAKESYPKALTTGTYASNPENDAAYAKFRQYLTDGNLAAANQLAAQFGRTPEQVLAYAKENNYQKALDSQLNTDSTGTLGTQTQSAKDAIFAKFNGLLAEGKLDEAITLAGENGRTKDQVMAYAKESYPKALEQTQGQKDVIYAQFRKLLDLGDIAGATTLAEQNGRTKKEVGDYILANRPQLMNSEVLKGKKLLDAGNVSQAKEVVGAVGMDENAQNKFLDTYKTPAIGTLQQRRDQNIQNAGVQTSTQTLGNQLNSIRSGASLTPGLGTQPVTSVYQRQYQTKPVDPVSWNQPK